MKIELKIPTMDVYFLHFAVSKRPFLLQKNEERRRADGV